MKNEPALLIFAPIADGFDLAHLSWCEAARERILINHAKFTDLDMDEVIIDGMPFLLSRFTAEETGHRFAKENFEKLADGLSTSNDSAIGVTPGEILTSGQHLPEVIQRILILGRWIGDSLAATAVAWIPSGALVGFECFEEAVGEYLAGKPLPSKFQTASAED